MLRHGFHLPEAQQGGAIQFAHSVHRQGRIPTLAYAINKIAGTDDLLVREQHDIFGWHYHYCDHQKRRSDVLMSFDRMRLEPGKAMLMQKFVPLCWELPGVNKAQFKAKPWNWKDRKRESVYAACIPDLAMKPDLTYKPPSKEA